jgi:hypothetical protein
VVGRNDGSEGSKREMNAGEAILAMSYVFPQLMKMATHGTKLVWNSFKSTLREPSKRREAVIEETT